MAVLWKCDVCGAISPYPLPAKLMLEFEDNRHWEMCAKCTYKFSVLMKAFVEGRGEALEVERR